MSYRIVYSNKALNEDIPFLTLAIAERISAAINQKLTQDPLRFGKPLKHVWQGHRSLRVGDYRVIYRIDRDNRSVFIVSLGHRRYIYDEE